MLRWLRSLFSRSSNPVTTATHATTAKLTTGESGNAAQAFAENALTASGYTIIKRNLTIKGGELDLVVRDPRWDGIVVVEVRACSVNSRVRREEVLPLSKQKQVTETARRALPASGRWRPGQNLRFDAVLVELDASGRPQAHQHLVNAFTSERRDWF